MRETTSANCVQINSLPEEYIRMIRIVLDAQTVERFHDLHEPLELCDTSGRVLARAMPVIDISQCDPVSPGITDEELRRRASSDGKGLSTPELIAHLGQLKCTG